MLALFFDNFVNEEHGKFLKDFSISKELKNENKVVLSNELIATMPPNLSFMFGKNLWWLTTEDKVVCFNENAARYIAEYPGPQRYSCGFDYEGFKRIKEIKDVI